MALVLVKFVTLFLSADPFNPTVLSKNSDIDRCAQRAFLLASCVVHSELNRFSHEIRTNTGVIGGKT